jgi:hypothetical protein
MRRRDLLRTAGLGSIAAAGLPSLLQLTVSPVSAQSAETEFQFVGLSTAGMVGAVEHFIAATGNGTISGSTVDGGGAFTHYDNAAVGLPKPILGSGTWRATRLLGYKEVGTFGSLVAGVADIQVELTREMPEPATLTGRLHIVSNLSPAGIMSGEPSGYALSIFGGPVGPFRQRPNAGMTIFSKAASAPSGEAPPAAAAPASAVALKPQADRPQDALLLEAGRMLKGHLAAGGPRGQFAYYKFEYPGDESTYTVDLHIFPDRYDLLQHAGFNLYGPDPTKLYGKGGPQHTHRPNVSGDFSSVDPGIYTIQVYNYDPSIPIDFEISGTQGAAPSRGGDDDSGPASPNAPAA